MNTTPENTPPPFTAREYTREGDKELIAEWWRATTGEELNLEYLPPVGIMVDDADGQPVSACWGYMAVGIGAATIDAPIAAPGLPADEECAALLYAIGALESVLKTHNYNVIIVHTHLAAAHWLEKFAGYEKVANRVQLLKVLPLPQ